MNKVVLIVLISTFLYSKQQISDIGRYYLKNVDVDYILLEDGSTHISKELFLIDSKTGIVKKLYSVIKKDASTIQKWRIVGQE